MTLEIILGIILVLIAAVAVWDNARRREHAPRLVFMVLPPYEVPDLIVTGGVVVENRGNAPALQVRIALAYPDSAAYKIRHLQILSDMEYVQQSGGESESFVTLTVKQINPDQKLIIYFSGPNRLFPRVTVMQGVSAVIKSKN
jgi:hypothetical protein